MNDSPETTPLSDTIDDAEVRGRSDALLERGSALAGRLSMFLEMVKVRLMSSGALAERVHVDDDEADDWRFLRRPALLGFLALVSIAVGSSLTSSPFKLEMSGTWFFGVPSASATSPSQTGLLFGLVAVYGGLVLLMRVWWGLIKALTRRPGVPVKYLIWVLLLWLIPMLIVPPIFSRDVFSYAAQGELMSHHINPYFYGPGTLGAGPYVNPVDPLWMNTPAPYGPLFLVIDGFFASASLHHELVTVILLRLLAVAGLALIAYCMPILARAYGRDVGPIFTLAVLNPLVLLMLIGGAHNDAIMVGLLVAGVTLAKTKHPAWGVLLCTAATAIKAPAALGVIYIGWTWEGTGLSLRQRLRPLLKAGALSAGFMSFLCISTGLGFGWIANLETPGTVRSWLAPATGIGMLFSGLAHVVGVQISLTTWLTITRLIGFAGAGIAAVWLLKESDRIGTLKAFGLSMLLFVALGPVVQPWYLSWGLILLAPVALGRIRTLIVAVSVVSPFINLPGGHTLLSELIHSNPLSVAAALVVCLLVLLAPLGRWATSWRLDGGPDGEDEDLAALQVALD